MNKTACILYYTDNRYDELAKCAVNSFAKFHNNEVDLYPINYTNRHDFNKSFLYYDAGDETYLMQYIYAYELMRQKNYSKVIILGCDTITCSRLDEFLDDNTSDMFGTLNYPSVEQTDHFKTPVLVVGKSSNGNDILDVMNLNADVVCFNNPDALKCVIDLSIEHYGPLSIQGGLNEVAIKGLFKTNIVDFPYYSSKVVYNARSKGVYGTEMISKGVLKKHGPPLDGTPSPVKRWFVDNDKLYTEDKKQIKVWHYVEGLGCQTDTRFKELVDDFKFLWFNKDTVNFFKTNCDCGEFFDKEYVLKARNI
jgi:hypothetical protein